MSRSGGEFYAIPSSTQEQPCVLPSFSSTLMKIRPQNVATVPSPFLSSATTTVTLSCSSSSSAASLLPRSMNVSPSTMARIGMRKKKLYQLRPMYDEYAASVSANRENRAGDINSTVNAGRQSLAVGNGSSLPRNENSSFLPPLAPASSAVYRPKINSRQQQPILQEESSQLHAPSEQNSSKSSSSLTPLDDNEVEEEVAEIAVLDTSNGSNSNEPQRTNSGGEDPANSKSKHAFIYALRAALASLSSGAESFGEKNENEKERVVVKAEKRPVQVQPLKHGVIMQSATSTVIIPGLAAIGNDQTETELSSSQSSGNVRRSQRASRHNKVYDDDFITNSPPPPPARIENLTCTEIVEPSNFLPGKTSTPKKIKVRVKKSLATLPQQQQQQQLTFAQRLKSPTLPSSRVNAIIRAAVRAAPHSPDTAAQKRKTKSNSNFSASPTQAPPDPNTLLFQQQKTISKNKKRQRTAQQQKLRIGLDENCGVSTDDGDEEDIDTVHKKSSRIVEEITEQDLSADDSDWQPLDVDDDGWEEAVERAQKRGSKSRSRSPRRREKDPPLLPELNSPSEESISVDNSQFGGSNNIVPSDERWGKGKTYDQWRQESAVADAELQRNAARRNRHTCDVCFNRYSTLSNLTRHQRIHVASADGGGTAQCPHCDRKYASPAALAMHIQSHIKSYQCDQCSKRFSRNWLLTNHMRMHTGERPFVCPVASCKKTFADRSNYRTHLMATHATKQVDLEGRFGAWQGPFVCPGCSRSFALKTYLLKHVRKWCKPALEVSDASADGVAAVTAATAAAIDEADRAKVTAMYEALAKLEGRTLENATSFLF